jgi:tetratricopeptide (TPR) repeat protein
MTVFALSALSLPRAAHSQSATTASESPSSRPPSEAEQDARTRFERARALFQRENFDAALVEFQRVYELMEGNPRRYIVLFNIAQSHERMFRYDEALQFYRRYLDEGGTNVQDRVQVEAAMGALENLLGTVEIRVNIPSAEVWIDERRIGQAPGSIRVPGGRHVVQLRATGFANSQQEVQLPAHATRQLTFSLEALHERHGPRPFWFIGTTVAAVVAYGVGAAFGIQALVLHGDAVNRLANPATAFTVGMPDEQAIRDAALRADIFYATGAVLTVGAVVLFLVTDWRGGAASATERPHARTRPLFVPSVSNSAFGATATVTF